MQKLPFRAVISDMDGTLLNGHSMIGDFSVATFEKLAQKNVDIILATGRNYTDVSSILGKMKIDRATMITSNGAQVHDLQGNLLYSDYLNEDIAFELMNIPFDNSRVCLNSYQDDGWFININLPQLHKYHKDSGFMYEVVDFKRHHGRKTEKVFFIGREARDLTELEQQLREKFGNFTSITYSTPQCLEVMNKNVSKAAALEYVIEARDYDLSQCIAFGDGMNDIEMLTEVGKGCVMGNADPRVTAALPDCERIGLNKDEAVASYLRAIFGIY